MKRVDERHVEDASPSMENSGNHFCISGGGVLPPTPPVPESASDSFRDLFEDFNRESDELPPLELIEGDLGRLEEQRESGQGGSTSSRPPRQLRSRNVARSIKGSKTVKFHDVVDCIESNQHYQEKIHLEGESTIFPSSQYSRRYRCYAT